MTKPNNTVDHWEDASIYSRGEKTREPWLFVQKVNGITLKVHRHIHYPGLWLATCDAVCLGPMPLDSFKLGDAKLEAVRFVQRRADELLTNSLKLKP